MQNFSPNTDKCYGIQHPKDDPKTASSEVI